METLDKPSVPSRGPITAALQGRGVGGGRAPKAGGPRGALPSPRRLSVSVVPGAAADPTRSPWRRSRPCSLPRSCGPLVCLSPSRSSAKKAPVSVRPARVSDRGWSSSGGPPPARPPGSLAGGPARTRDPRDAGLSAPSTEAAEEGSLWRLAAELPTSWP